MNLRLIALRGETQEERGAFAGRGFHPEVVACARRRLGAAVVFQMDASDKAIGQPVNDLRHAQYVRLEVIVPVQMEDLGAVCLGGVEMKRLVGREGS